MLNRIPRRQQRRPKHNKRKLIAEALETRRLLAGDSMMAGENGFEVEPIFTVGEEINGYTAPGVLDGLGAFELNDDTVRVLANHELLNNRGYEYEVNPDNPFTLTGARISYFDIDKDTREIVDAGLAYDTIYDANGTVATDNSFLPNIDTNPAVPGNEIGNGFSRFCSAVLVEAHQFGRGRGLTDRIFFTGEEDGGSFNPVGGAEWALDPASGEIWAVPAMGRGAWENITEIDTRTRSHVAFILADDSSPFDADGDGEAEAAPLFLYLGKKDTSPDANFLERNGLSDGNLYVWVSKTGELTPLDFNTSGKLQGEWVEIENSPQLDQASEDGSTGYDEFGYPTQRNLWTQAEAVGAFGFSRPEDVAVNPKNGSEIVLASTGVDTYAIDPETGDGADTFGTLYTVKTSFHHKGGELTPKHASVRIIYDGDADPTRALRSPDNLAWADDGLIYVQEDKAENDTLGTEEPLFGDGAANPNEAGIVSVHPRTGEVSRVAQIDRNVILDPTTSESPFDTDAGVSGAWESSGIIDVSSLFDEAPGSLFLFDVQAHGIEDQTDVNGNSRINDGDLVEGGQMSFLIAPDQGDKDDDCDDRGHRTRRLLFAHHGRRGHDHDDHRGRGLGRLF